MNVATGVSSVAALCILLLYLRREGSRKDRPASYILANQVTHARLLPVESAHAFTYPTVTLLLPLKALEECRLDLGGGWIFGYGGLHGRLTGLRPSAYLMNDGQDGRSIWQKLTKILSERDYEVSHLKDAWIVSMPSFLGYEGINPLTVYYCYNISCELWLIVLEVHNTFGERHVYVLEVGKGEDIPPKGFDYQWTFPRHFHVSPFNDRLGFYIASFTAPSHPPTATTHGRAPRPIVRIHYHPPADSDSSSDSAPSPGPLKLSAIIRPVFSTPFTTPAWLFALVSSPLALLLTSPRILYQAWILHYQKRLDVFPRPEPKPTSGEWHEDPREVGDRGGIGWQDEGALERYARGRVEMFLSKRADEVGVQVTLVPGNASVPQSHFGRGEKQLKIHYLSPRFFTILFVCPSARHALLLGSRSEKIFFVSSAEVFLSVFGSDAPTADGQNMTASQRLRIRPIPPAVFSSPSLHVPTRHPLRSDSKTRSMVDFIVLFALLALDGLEKMVFTAVRARFVPGQEPWNAWTRAIDLLEAD